MKRILTIAILAASFAHADEPYCTDTDVKEWESQVSATPYDAGLQMLHALWIGLCQKVESGNLDRDVANVIFEKQRHALIEERMMKNRRTLEGI
ncbi:MAG: hypothetical protein H6980_11200 [Gammaproteobacteria bacterium]|nr:hypothetical protein [Gammaproteobacteria bacterium]